MCGTDWVSVSCSLTLEPQEGRLSELHHQQVQAALLWDTKWAEVHHEHGSFSGWNEGCVTSDF